MRSFAHILQHFTIFCLLVIVGCGKSDEPKDLLDSKGDQETAAQKTGAGAEKTAAKTPDSGADTAKSGDTSEQAPSDESPGYGSISGQFVLTGEVPEREVIVEEGDASAKDAAVCAASSIYSKKLVVDPDSKGIGNVYIYLRRAPSIHPDLESSSEKTVVFDQKGCQFLTHALLVRSDQAVVIKSDDPIVHNTHTYPLLGQPANFLIQPNDREGQELSGLRAERQPFEVKCDVHPWMLAWWLVLDHPYAAVSDEQGRFTIEKLPVGEHEFYIVHEGQVLNRSFAVAVTANETTTIPPIEYSAEQLLK